MIEKAKKLCSLGAMHRNKKTIEADSLRFTSPRCAVLFRNKYKYKYKYKHCLNTNHIAWASIYMSISKHINININIKCLSAMSIGQSTRHRLNTSPQVVQNRMNKMYWLYLFSDENGLPYKTVRTELVNTSTSSVGQMSREQSLTSWCW